jgi:tripartite-type tricarboxylate transporter receptor subunit TctC
MHRAPLLTLLTLLPFVFADTALAQYPDHPIRMIVPQAAGSATDTLTRVLASALAEELHQQVVVDDRPGGALTLGLDLTAKSPPDGYTLCMGPIGALAITRHLVVPLPYDIARDFQPIALVARGQLLLAVSPATVRAGTDRQCQGQSRQALECFCPAMDRRAMSAASCSNS